MAEELKPAAWRYRWKLDGEWTSWRVADHSQKTRHLRDLEEYPLYAAPQPLIQELVEALEAALPHLRRAAHYAENQRPILEAAVKVEVALTKATTDSTQPK